MKHKGKLVQQVISHYGGFRSNPQIQYVHICRSVVEQVIETQIGEWREPCMEAVTNRECPGS